MLYLHNNKRITINMKYISLANTKAHRLPFYLAMEEYVAKYLDEDEAFFMWQVRPTVIFGRNQLIEKEVNLQYCKAHGIETYRRKSGGGCVYADMGNIMFSYITKTYNVAEAYGKYISKVVDALKTLGVDAMVSGRNDIVVDGRKVSGNAFYHVNGKSVVHGTMLYDTDVANMANAITPAVAKLISKGVDSVRNRITTLNNYLNISIDDFKKIIVKDLCDEAVALDEQAESVICDIEKTYLSDSFIYGNNPHCNIEKDTRIEGVGEFKVLIEINKSIVKKINIMGDYFLNGEIDAQLLEKLIGIPYNESSIRCALEDVNVGDVILNLNKEQFIKLIII